MSGDPGMRLAPPCPSTNTPPPELLPSWLPSSATNVLPAPNANAVGVCNPDAIRIGRAPDGARSHWAAAGAVRTIRAAAAAQLSLVSIDAPSSLDVVGVARHQGPGAGLRRTGRLALLGGHPLRILERDQLIDVVGARQQPPELDISLGETGCGECRLLGSARPRPPDPDPRAHRSQLGDGVVREEARHL